MIEDLEEQLREVITAPVRGTGVHPLADRAELEAGSPLPFRGKPDQTHPEIDLADPLYVPRFLVREWGWDVFAGSHYRQTWEHMVAQDAEKFVQDLKASERKGKR